MALYTYLFNNVKNELKLYFYELFFFSCYFKLIRRIGTVNDMKFYDYLNYYKWQLYNMHFENI